MKLKTLLLGSAAALIAVTGARAADAVVAEPEPMDYVKVCDMYGSGFYYIPGTDTCLSFSGYVRVDYDYDNQSGGTGVSEGRWDLRTRLNIDARNETDYGTLRSQMRIQSDFETGGDGDALIDRALISLGGLRLGYSDSYTTTLHGYGNYMEKNDGYYGYDQAVFFDYTYAANGMTLTAGIQDSGVAHSSANTTPVGTNPSSDFDYYVGASYSGGMFTLAGSYIYHTALAGASDAGAWKFSLVVNPMDGLGIKGWYVGDESGSDTPSVSGTGDWAWGVSANYDLMEDVNLRVAYTDSESQEYYWGVGLIWDAAPGLSIRPEIQIRENTGQAYNVRVYRNF